MKSVLLGLVFVLCSSVMADEEELNIRCKRSGTSGVGTSDFFCFIENDTRIFEGTIKDEKALITRLDLYNDAISLSRMSKGKIVGLKKMKTIDNVGQTMADVQRDVNKFCKRTGIKDCVVSKMFFHINAKASDVSDFYDLEIYKDKLKKIPYKK